MKKFYFLFLFALIASISNLWAAEVVLWEEDFSSSSLSGYKTVGAGTKIYEENLAGGTSPELLIAKDSGSFEVEVSDLQGCSGILTLTFKCNKTTSTFANVTTSTTGVSVSTPKNDNGVWTTEFNVPANTQSLTFKVANTNKGNGRYDDFKLVGYVQDTKCAAPTFNLKDDETYADAQILTITSATEGATIAYTIEGVNSGTQTGTAVSPASITLTANDIYEVKAKAQKEGLADSEESNVTFSIEKKCAAPTFNLKEGETYTDVRTLEIATTTEGATIEYTIEGDKISTITGTATSSASIPLTENDDYMVTAKVVKEDYAEAEELLSFTIAKKCEKPTFNLSEGATYGEAKDLIISTTTDGAKIEYTIVGGGDINISETADAPVTVNLAQNGTYSVEAYAIKDDYTKSEKAELTFTIDLATGVPTFSVAAGTYKEAQSIVLTPGEGGKRVMYKLNDKADFLPYTDPIELTEDGTYTITAYTEATIALAKSEEVSNTYVINLPLSEPYILCTNPAWLTDGAKIIFASSATAGSAYAMSKTQKTNNRDVANVTIEALENKSITEKDADVAVFTVGKSNGNLTFYTDDSTTNGSTIEGYLCAASSTSNWLRTQSSLDKNGEWSVTIASDGAATITAQGDFTRKVMKYNSSSKLFSCYQSGQNPIYIYLLGSTSSVSKVSAEDGVKVVAAEGGVEVVAAEAADVAVYTVAGQLVRAQRVAEGSTLVNVPAGFYVVRAAGTVAKVVVK